MERGEWQDIVDARDENGPSRGGTATPYEICPEMLFDAHAWFLEMMRDHEEFEVETDRAGEWPMPFWDETIRRVVVE